MATEVLMPQLGLTMKEGLVMEWNKKVGDQVAKGDSLLSVENDKAVINVEAQTDGILLAVLVPEMAAVPVGTVIAYIGQAGETVPAGQSSPPPAAAAAQPGPAPQAPAAAPAQAAVPPAARAPVPPPPAAPAAPVPAARSGSYGGTVLTVTDGFVPASPLARRTARQLGINLASVRGTGPGGAVIARDLPDIAEGLPAGPLASPTFAAPAAPQGQAFENVRLTRVQAVGADRMAESWVHIPQFTLFDEAEAGNLLALAAKLKARGQPVSVTVIIARLLALAVKRHPMLNGSWQGDGTVRVYRDVHINIAVDTEDGLMVPVLRDCAGRGFGELGGELRSLSEKARAKTLGSSDLEGGTITLSNLGMFGVKRFRAIVNPPQAAILAVGAISERVVPVGGGFGTGKFIEYSITADHRIVDGAYAARFMATLKGMLEDPGMALA